MEKRSIKDDETYANYFGLPLLHLHKNSWGQGNLINAFFTINGRIAVLIESNVPAGLYWEHPGYMTDTDVREGTMILYKPSSVFETDIKLILDGRYSHISHEAKMLIGQYSGLRINVLQPNWTRESDRLWKVLMRHADLREELRPEEGEEVEPPLRPMDILDNVDTDIV